jgi:pyruvate dehydrogenase E2 component (dihydrolipoamide acetyltransferase)
VVPVGAVVASFQLIDDESERATEARPATPSGPTRAGTRVEPLSPTQRAFVYRLRRSASMAIPATIAIDIPAISGTELTPPSEKPRPLLTLAWAVAQAVRQHPRFLCTMRNDDSVNVYDYLNLGIAVALPGDELVTAVIPAADRVPREEFASHYKAAIKAAIDGTNRAGYDTQILLTYLGDWQIEAAVPTLVAPANSVIFLGAPRAGSTTTRLTLTFDHRLVNGARAAGLLAQITASTGAHFCRH